MTTADGSQMVSGSSPASLDCRIKEVGQLHGNRTGARQQEVQPEVQPESEGHEANR